MSSFQLAQASSPLSAITSTALIEIVHLRQLGAKSVGRKSLIHRFEHNEWCEITDPTLEAGCRRTVTVNGREILAEVEDITNPEWDGFYGPLTHACKTGDGFLVIYSVTSKESFDAIPRYLDLIKKHNPHPDAVPIVLVANKCDSYLLSARQVTPEEGERFAQTMNLAGYIETSAKGGHNVEGTYSQLALLALKHKQRATYGDAGSLEEREVESNPALSAFCSSKCLTQ
ncbi:P-loop containing nucleoside triphosphate hydrolase protein [Cristinia sonorae]|uniref:P-loop containing nucleoside triphosphate hydrolase protein n=1 Tax=Cristinia sonorae TaxID=1940300 RepID=A0A8K0UPT1_9AGAR|nr:P-loop containing nucleoside triphosphate hydrolase protein [Cristinia sonorae]